MENINILSRLYWLRAIAENQPEGALVALHEVGVHLTGEVTVADLHRGIDLAIADGEEAGLWARFNQLPVDWNDIPDASKVKIMDMVRAGQLKLLKQTTNGGSTGGTGFDVQNVGTWQSITGAILNGLTGTGILNNGANPAPGGISEQSEPKPSGPPEDEGGIPPMVITIGLLALGLGLLAIVGFFVFDKK